MRSLPHNCTVLNGLIAIKTGPALLYKAKTPQKNDGKGSQYGNCFKNTRAKEDDSTLKEVKRKHIHRSYHVNIYVADCRQQKVRSNN